MKPLVRMITQAIGATPRWSRAASMHLVADVGSVHRIARSVAADTARDVAILSSCSKKSMTDPKNHDLTEAGANHIDELRCANTATVNCAGSSLAPVASAGTTSEPADVTAERWGVLFNAVIERLEAAARQQIETGDGPHQQIEIDRVRRIVLECVEALRQLNATARS